MANLIPPDAKKAIVTEYWFRVVVLWSVMTGVALIFVGVLQVPTFILLSEHTASFSNAYADAEEKKADYEAGEQEIESANQLAKLLAANAQGRPFSELIDILDEIAGSAIVIADMQFRRSEGALQNIEIRGVAADRRALADFSTNLESHPLFLSADLPFSNLAKDKDIAFSITIVPSNIDEE